MIVAESQKFQTTVYTHNLPMTSLLRNSSRSFSNFLNRLYDFQLIVVSVPSAVCVNRVIAMPIKWIWKKRFSKIKQFQLGFPIYQIAPENWRPSCSQIKLEKDE